MRFIIIPTPSGYKLICQYGVEEAAWGPFKTFSMVVDRIQQALTNLEKQKL